MTRNPDPVVMYLVIRTSLGMNAGKVGASCGHAVQEMVRFFYTDRMISTVDWRSFHDWLHEDAPSYAKIVLGASDAEFDTVKEYVSPDRYLHHLVADRGFSQVPEGAETCLGVWPMRKSKALDCLRVLKPLR